MQRQQARTQWCVSSAWLECRPVTAEVMGSSPIHTAKPLRNSGGAFAVNMAILGWLAHPKKYAAIFFLCWFVLLVILVDGVLRFQTLVDRLGSYALVEITLLLMVVIPTVAVYKFTKE